MGVNEDFQRKQLVQNGRTRQIKKLSMAMGYVNEMQFFFRQAAADTLDRKLFQGAAATIRATLAAFPSLQTGQTLSI